MVALVAHINIYLPLKSSFQVDLQVVVTVGGMGEEMGGEKNEKAREGQRDNKTRLWETGGHARSHCIDHCPNF